MTWSLIGDIVMDVRFSARYFDSCWTFCQSADQYVTCHDIIYLSSGLFQWQSFVFVGRLYGRQCSLANDKPIQYCLMG